MLKKLLTISATFLQVLLKKYFQKYKIKKYKNIYFPKSKKSLIFFALKTVTQFPFLKTLPQVIEDLINSMKTNKASGPNSIPTKILKLFKKGFLTLSLNL